jgi:preprotein translocase subunit SecF
MAARRPKFTAKDRADFRKGVIDSQAAAQVKIARERGRQRRSVEKTKTAQRVIERQQSEAARVAAHQQKSSISIEQSEAIREGRQSAKRQERVERSVTGSGVWSTLMMLTFLFFGMIILYVLVHHGGEYGHLAGGIGSFISGLSSNTPLFVKKPSTSS